MQEEKYPTTEEGYASFIEWCHKVEEEYEVKENNQEDHKKVIRRER